MIALYGIANCDTVKKARAWLGERGVAYAFHDFKKLGADHARLSDWSDHAGWDKLLNRRGMTFRALPMAETADLDRTKALRLMQAHPSLIKRPVVEIGRGLLVGFDPAAWERAFV
ncbi:MAG: arsenate reductase [Croceibacterium sp.]